MTYELRMILDNDCCITNKNIKMITFTSEYVYITFQDDTQGTLRVYYSNGKSRYKHFKLMIKEDR